MKNFLFVALFSFSLVSGVVAEPQAIFVVRHAERADASGPPATDPGLSEAGRTRAQALASTLHDAQINAIYATEFRRTQETAAPLAKSLGIKIEVVPAKETAALLAKVKAASGNVLVVGHSNTVPEIVRSLGEGTVVALAESEYDNLSVIVPDSKLRLLRLHYR